MDTANETFKHERWKSPTSINCPRVEVSNLGRVRTVPYERCYTRLGVPRTAKYKGRIFKCMKDSRGRRIIGGGIIKKSMNGRCMLVHRLVAECFVRNPKPKEYDMVFFKDGDVGNCRASNLEWGSRKDRDVMARGNCAIYKIFVMSNGKKIGEYIGCGETGRAIGCTKQAVHNAIMNGSPCMGYQLVATKCNGEKPFHSLEEARKSTKEINKVFDIPDSIYLKHRLDITPKAVF